MPTFGHRQNPDLSVEKKRNGQAVRNNGKKNDFNLKYCTENPKNRDTTLLYLSFIYNTTINRLTGTTPLFMFHRQEYQCSVDILYAKPHDGVLIKERFEEKLVELFRDPHKSPIKVLGRTNVDERISTGGKFVVNLMRRVTNSSLYGRKKNIWSKKSFGQWEGPYVVMARVFRSQLLVTKVSNP